MIEQCRLCLGEELEPVLDLGQMPIVNNLRKQDDLSSEESFYPLEVVFCTNCTLLQITHIIPPSELFSDYTYFSSYSETMLEHSRTLVESVISKHHLNSDNFVVEIGSNDGYLLQFYKQNDIPILGVEPAKNVAEKARNERDIPTMSEFFQTKVANRIAKEYGVADVIHANNVLAHVPNINDFVRGLRILLKQDGVAIIEVPYVKNLIDACEFDTIYHEHIYYYSLTALSRLFQRHDLLVSDVKQVPIHGGSLRIYVSHQGTSSPSSRVKHLLKLEEVDGMDKWDYYKNFADEVNELKKSLVDLISDIKEDGNSLAAYGAAAKGCVLLNYLGFGKQTIEFVVDRNPHKQGKFMPGVQLPILKPEALVRDNPDYVLILAWNFSQEIVQQQKAYLEQGGNFLIPIPEPKIVGKDKMAQ